MENFIVFCLVFFGSLLSGFVFFGIWPENKVTPEKTENLETETYTSSDLPLLTYDDLCSDWVNSTNNEPKYIVEVRKSVNGQVFMRVVYRSNKKVFMTTETYKNKNFLYKKAVEFAEVLNTEVVYND